MINLTHKIPPFLKPVPGNDTGGGAQVLREARGISFPLIKGGCAGQCDGRGMLFPVRKLLKSHPTGYRLYRVAHATSGHPLAASFQLILALSIPLSSCQQSMDSASSGISFPLFLKGGALVLREGRGIFFCLRRPLKTHPYGYRLYRVAPATFGHSLAAFLQLNFALSIPLSSCQQSMDSASSGFSFPLIKGNCVGHQRWRVRPPYPGVGGGIFFPVPNLPKTHPPGYPIDWVAPATFGHPLAAFLQLNFALSIPLTSCQQSMDSASSGFSFPLFQKGGAVVPREGGRISFPVPKPLKIHSLEYRLYRVAHATFGHPLAAFRQVNFALSIPLSSHEISIDSANFRGSPFTPTHTLQPCPGAASHTTRSGPSAEGARRVFSNPKLRFGFPQTAVLVLLNLPLCSTTKR